MIEVKIHKEIRDFKSKVFLNLTARQILSLIICMGINIPLYIFLKPVIGEEIASWLIMANAVPIFMVGFIKKDGMTYEKYAFIILNYNFFTPKIRKYKTENIIIYLENQKNMKGKVKNEPKKNRCKKKTKGQKNKN